MIAEPRVGMRVRVVLRGTYHALHRSAEAIALFEGLTGAVAVIEPDTDTCLVAFDTPVYTKIHYAVGDSFDGSRLFSGHFNFGELEELPIETRGAVTSRTDSTAENIAGILRPHYSDEVFRAVDILLHTAPVAMPVGQQQKLRVEKPRNAPLVCPACDACLLEDQLSTAEVPHPIVAVFDETTGALLYFVARVAQEKEVVDGEGVQPRAQASEK